MIHQSDASQALKLFVVLSKTAKYLHEHAHRDVRKSGLTLTEFGVLDLLYHKGSFPIQKIREHILISSGSTTYVIDKLEKKGLLSRNPCPQDRRVIYAKLTLEGEKLFENLFPSHREVIAQAVESLSPEEKDQMIQLLKKLGRSAKEKLDK